MGMMMGILVILLITALFGLLINRSMTQPHPEEFDLEYKIEKDRKAKRLSSIHNDNEDGSSVCRISVSPSDKTYLRAAMYVLYAGIPLSIVGYIWYAVEVVDGGLEVYALVMLVGVSASVVVSNGMATALRILSRD